jgi:transposase
LFEYDELQGIQWQWQAMDGAMAKAPLGGEATGKNPTDRAKLGTKRSVLTDGAGVPLAVVVSGANTPDMKLVESTLASMVMDRPAPTKAVPHNLCLDKGYDFPEVRELVAKYGYTAHIPYKKKRNDPEPQSKDLRQKIPGYRSRRWVVERTHSWMNRFRRLLIRWEKKPKNYLGFLHFACAWITLRAAGVLG